MSYKLKQPYTDEERANFIVEYNHNQGLRIEEVDNFVEVEVEGEVEPYTTIQNQPTLYALEPNEIMVDGEPTINENYAEEQAQKEHERIQELFMTRSDFFDGTIDAWGVGEAELLLLVQRMLTGLPLENNQKLKAINNFKNALNFYRKHDLFKMLINRPIQLTEFTQVIITDKSLDKYFDEVAKGNKATAWQYLPQPTAIPIDPKEAEVPPQPSYDDI